MMRTMTANSQPDQITTHANAATPSKLSFVLMGTNCMLRGFSRQSVSIAFWRGRCPTTTAKLVGALPGLPGGMPERLQRLLRLPEA